MCNVDRLADAPAPCGLGAETHVFKRHISFAEEAEFLPSYMMYFAGCNFRCAFCVQAPNCFDPSRGPRADVRALARELQELVDRGAKTINLLGGEPSLHLHTILEIAATHSELYKDVRTIEALPILLNSNFYMTPQVIDDLEGVAKYYLADFKFGSDACAKGIAGGHITRYVSVVTRNLTHAWAQCQRTGARLLVRHLVMPGHVECCTKPVRAWVADNLPEVVLHLMDSYVPAYRAARTNAKGLGELHRLLTAKEILAAHAPTESSYVPVTVQGGPQRVKPARGER